SYRPTGTEKLYYSTAYVKGYVKDVDTENYGIIIMAKGKNDTGEEKQVIYANSNSKVLIYDNQKIMSGSIEDVEVGDFLFSTTPYGYAENLVVYKD
ncbi:MAG: hypothetical protein IJQ28_02780, partial [Clostridia bacterium]|nr:hypothetical protein [Clostridia bacterium]